MRTLRKTLSAFADVYQVLLHQREIRFHPSALLVSMFIISFTFSFSTNIPILLASLIFCLLIPPFLGIDTKKYYLVLGFTALFIFVISLPKITSFCFDNNKIIIMFPLSNEVKLFMLRAIVAASVVLLIMTYAGYWNIVRGLCGLGVPKKVADILLFMGLFIIMLLRWCSHRILGRYSRIYRLGLRKEWDALSSIIVDMFLNSQHASRIYYLGYLSRNINISTVPTHKISISDALLLVAVLALVIANFW